MINPDFRRFVVESLPPGVGEGLLREAEARSPNPLEKKKPKAEIINIDDTRRAVFNRLKEARKRRSIARWTKRAQEIESGLLEP